MSKLRNKMKTELELRGYTPTSIEHYIENVSRFDKHFNQSPAKLQQSTSISIKNPLEAL